MKSKDKENYIDIDILKLIITELFKGKVRVDLANKVKDNSRIELSILSSRSDIKKVINISTLTKISEDLGIDITEIYQKTLQKQNEQFQAEWNKLLKEVKQ